MVASGPTILLIPPRASVSLTQDTPARRIPRPALAMALLGTMGLVQPPRRPAWRWPAFSAALVAGLFALLSAWWGLGGTLGVDSLGGEIAALARERDPLIMTLAWVSAVVKAGGAVLACFLVVRPRRLPSRLVLVTAWISAVVLTVYGLLQQVGVLLLLSGAVVPDVPPTQEVLWARALLWEPWFWVWGLLLGLAAWCAPSVWSGPEDPA